MNYLHSTLDALRDRYTPISHTSTFRTTGQLTPEEFVLAGDFLVYKFPSWSWADASSPSLRVSYLPEGKQFLVTRGVPCARRLDQGFVGDGEEEVKEEKMGEGMGEGVNGEEGWLRTGGGSGSGSGKEVGRGKGKVATTEKDVRTLDGSGNVGDEGETVEEEEEEIPDIEDEGDDEEAIIRDPGTDKHGKSPSRTYNLYITYSPYYRTPRFYLSGYTTASQPLPPTSMFEDIMGDYKDKTVTLEDFPFIDPSHSPKMASIHPCRHASVMKVLLDRADAALKLRRERLLKRAHGQPHQGRGAEAGNVGMGMQGLVDETGGLALSEEKSGYKAGVAAAGGGAGDEWEVLQNEAEEDESAIRVDQYLVVFLKFCSSVTPTIEHDFTMGL